MPARVKTELLTSPYKTRAKLLNSESVKPSVVVEKRRKISKNRESKKCPLCFNLKMDDCSHGKAIISKISGLKAPFIGSYNKVLRNIEIPHSKRKAFQEVVLKKIDEFARSLTNTKIESPQDKKLYREKLIQGFYNVVKQEAERKFQVQPSQKDEDHENTSESSIMEDSDDESVDLSYECGSETEEDVLDKISEPASKKETLIHMTTPKKTCTASESNSTVASPTIVNSVGHSENIETPKEKVNTVDNMTNTTANKKKVSLTEENTDNGCLALLGKSDCESFSRVKQALELYLKCKIDRLHFRIPETSSKYNASHELSLEMIQELLDKPQLLAFYYTKCK